MEVKLESGDKLNIPSGCMAVIRDGILTIEKENIVNVEQLSNGDFFFYSDGTSDGDHGLAIFNRIYGVNNGVSIGVTCHAIKDRFGFIYVNCITCIDHSKLRLATEKEKQWMLEKLHSEGKDWDAVNKRIVEYGGNLKMEKIIM